eukprot:15915936-Heterocapsa_arctica.AAC.1
MGIWGQQHRLRQQCRPTSPSRAPRPTSVSRAPRRRKRRRASSACAERGAAAAIHSARAPCVILVNRVWKG